VREQGLGYIVGRNRRRSGEVFDYIQSPTGPWIERPVGIVARAFLAITIVCAICESLGRATPKRAFPQ
jgi:hypothetical protein